MDTCPKRRLSAIVAADIVGYSRLMGEDEPGTLALVRQHRRGILEPEIARNNGRTVKLMGDGTLAEFASVADAVSAAVWRKLLLFPDREDIPELERKLAEAGLGA